MGRLSSEAKVGIFVVVGVVLLAVLTMRIGKLGLRTGKGYDIQAIFDTASGLTQDASVEIAGVEVGRVRAISLQNGKALVVMRIHPGVRISEAAKAVIRTRGILGDKVIEMVPGPPGSPLIRAGGALTQTEPATDINTLMGVLGRVAQDISQLTQSLSRVVGGEKGEETLRTILQDLQQTISTIKRTVQDTDEDVVRIVSNLSDFSEQLKGIGESNMDDVRTIIINVRRASDQIGSLVAALGQITEKINRGEGTLGRLIQEEQTIDNLNQALSALKEISDRINRGEGTLGRLIAKEDTADRIDETLGSIKEITGKIKRGEGTLGRLIYEEDTVENLNTTLSSINEFLQQRDLFRTYLDYRGEYLVEEGGLKSYLTVRIQPKEDKYYLLQIIDDPGGREKTTVITRTIDGVTTTEERVETDKDELKFSAQVSKRFYDLGLRGGLFESTGGVGVDYYLFNDRLTLSLEAFDFSFDRNPHLKFRADFTPFRHIYLTAGVDDFISEDGRESFFVGGGFRFSDEDIKAILTSVSISPSSN